MTGSHSRRIEQLEQAQAKPGTPHLMEPAATLTTEQWEAGEHPPVAFVAGVGAVHPDDRLHVDGRTVTGAEYIEGLNQNQ